MAEHFFSSHSVGSTTSLGRTQMIGSKGERRPNGTRGEFNRLDSSLDI